MLSWDGEPVSFGSAVNYTCYQGRFFEEDRLQEMYKVECLDDGSYDEPEVWPKCLSSRINIFVIILIMIQ